MIELEFPIDPTDTAIGVMEHREHRAESASIERFFDAASVAVIGASRRQDTIGQRAGAQPRARRLHRPGVRREPERPTRCRACRRTRRSATSPTRSTSPIVAVPADAVQDVVLDCAAKGVHGLIVISSRLRRDRRGGPAAAAAAGRAGPLLRPAADRPQLPRRHQHRPRRLAQRLALAGDAAARPGRLLLPVRRARLGDPGEGRRTAASASRRSSAPATAPTCPATTCCSTGRRTTPPRSCCSTSSRSATRASSPGSRAGSRCASRSSRCGRAAPPRACRWATPCARSRRRRRRVDAMFRQAGVIQVDTLDEMFDVAQLLAHQPLPRGRRVAIVGNSDALGLLAADAAAAVGLVVEQVGRARRRGDRRGLRGRPRRGDRRPRRRRGGRGLHPAAQRRRRRGRRQRARRRRRAVRQAAGLDRSSAPRACPSCCGCPTSPARTAGRGSVPSYPAVEAAVRALARVVEYAVWLRAPRRLAAPASTTSTTAPPSGSSTRLLTRAPRGARPRPATSCTELLGRLRHRAVGRATPSPPRGGRRRRARRWAGTSCSRRPPTTCASGRTWPTCGATSTRRGDGATPGSSLTQPDHRPGQRRLRRAAQRAARACRSPIAQHRGPALRPGRVLRHLGPAHRAAGRPVLPDPAARPTRDAADMVREIKSSPMLFGYRGSEVVDVAEIERLIRRVAQLQNDLPQVQRARPVRWCWPAPRARPC